jgi:hypothetical protein
LSILLPNQVLNYAGRILSSGDSKNFNIHQKWSFRTTKGIRILISNEIFEKKFDSSHLF